MRTALLFVINFIIILSLIKLLIGKYGNYKITKFSFSKDNINSLGKRQTRFNNILISLNLMFLFLIINLASNSFTIMLSTIPIAIIDIIATIGLGAFSKLKSIEHKK